MTSPLITGNHSAAKGADRVDLEPTPRPRRAQVEHQPEGPFSRPVHIKFTNLLLAAGAFAGIVVSALVYTGVLK